MGQGAVKNLGLFFDGAMTRDSRLPATLMAFRWQGPVERASDLRNPEVQRVKKSP